LVVHPKGARLQRFPLAATRTRSRPGYIGADARAVRVGKFDASQWIAKRWTRGSPCKAPRRATRGDTTANCVAKGTECVVGTRTGSNGTGKAPLPAQPGLPNDTWPRVQRALRSRHLPSFATILDGSPSLLGSWHVPWPPFPGRVVRTLIPQHRVFERPFISHDRSRGNPVIKQVLSCQGNAL
jgi:hypothetical protein